MRRWQVGVDEVGRGPVAGPVAVCAVLLRQTPRNKKQAPKALKGIRDSKKLSRKQREVWFEKLSRARRDGVIDFACSFVSARAIDREGIMRAIRMATSRVLSRMVERPTETAVLLDGGITAPERYVNQKTIVRGDEQEGLIAAASIVAKVLRDRKMTRYAKRFPEYGFQRHKGYGTQAHFRALKKHGACTLHRRSFLTSL